jgi:cytoskeleton protein RodZ
LQTPGHDMRKRDLPKRDLPKHDLPKHDLGSLPTPAWSMGGDVSQETVGQRLRARREHLGESLETVVRDTRLSRQAIEAIEADDYASISSDFYVRGFLKIYARYLEFDTEVVLDAYERQTSVSRLVTTGEPEEHDDVHTYFQVQAPKGRTLSPAQGLLLFITAATLAVFMMSVNRGKSEHPAVAQRPAVTAPGTPATATTGGRLPGVTPPSGTAIPGVSSRASAAPGDATRR